MATKVKFPNGKEYSVASVRFSREACEFVELVEESDEAKSEGRPFRKNGKIMKLIYGQLVSCLINGGQSEQEAEEAIASISMDDFNNSKVMEPILDAIGIR